MTRAQLSLLLGGLAALLLASGCGGTSDASGGGDASAGSSRLTLVVYSTPREVYEEVTKTFAATPEGEGVRFELSFGSSGEQSRAVEAGLRADVVALSLAPDVTRLVDAGLVAEDWADDEHRGMVTDSVVVLAFRKGNPKGIRGWEDLEREDVEVITPNPFTSGGARWNTMAAYGAALERGESHDEAVETLRAVYRNVSVQDKSARESLQTFLGGKGDVLIAYENEAILAQSKGEELEYLVPEETILIENPVAVLEESRNRERAEAFVAYLRSEEVQRKFAEAGYRPVLGSVLAAYQFPAPESLFTIADLGGWPEVQSRFFDRENGIMAEIQRELGQATD